MTPEERTRLFAAAHDALDAIIGILYELEKEARVHDEPEDSK